MRAQVVPDVGALLDRQATELSLAARANATLVVSEQEVVVSRPPPHSSPILPALRLFPCTHAPLPCTHAG